MDSAFLLFLTEVGGEKKGKEKRPLPRGEKKARRSAPDVIEGKGGEEHNIHPYNTLPGEANGG